MYVIDLNKALCIINLASVYIKKDYQNKNIKILKNMLIDLFEYENSLENFSNLVNDYIKANICERTFKKGIHGKLNFSKENYKNLNEESAKKSKYSQIEDESFKGALELLLRNDQATCFSSKQIKLIRDSLFGSENFKPSPELYLDNSLTGNLKEILGVSAHKVHWHVLTNVGKIKLFPDEEIAKLTSKKRFIFCKHLPTIEECKEIAIEEKKYTIKGDVLTSDFKIKADKKSVEDIYVRERVAAYIDCLYSIIYRVLLGARASLSIPVIKENRFFAYASVGLPDFTEIKKLVDNKALLESSSWLMHPEQRFMGIESLVLACFILQENDLHIMNYGKTTINDIDVIGKIDHDYIQHITHDFQSFEKFNFMTIKNSNPMSTSFHLSVTQGMRFSPFKKNSIGLCLGHAFREKFLDKRRKSTVTTEEIVGFLENSQRENFSMTVVERALFIEQILSVDFQKMKKNLIDPFTKELLKFIPNEGIDKEVRSGVLHAFSDHYKLISNRIQGFKDIIVSNENDLYTQLMTLIPREDRKNAQLNKASRPRSVSS